MAGASGNFTTSVDCLRDTTEGKPVVAAKLKLTFAISVTGLVV